MADRREMVRSQVETARSLVENLVREGAAENRPLEETQELAKRLLSSLRFNGSDYFLVIDLNPKNKGLTIAHPNDKLVGKNLWTAKDGNGVEFVVNQIAAARNGGGFTEFEFPRLGETVPAPKVSYSLAYEPWQWAIISALYVDDVFTAFYDELWKMALWILPLVSLIAGASLLLSNSITKPIAGITVAMRKLAEGAMDTTIPGAGSCDEIGQMAEATEIFRDSMIRAGELAHAQEEEQKVRQERANRIEMMTKKFDESAASLLQTVTASAAEMERSAAGMADNADDTNSRSTNVATAAEQAAANVQTVASATEELSASISEIGSQVSKSSSIASQAVSEAVRTDRQIQGLANAAEKIGQVVSMIAAIAEQTNLLALNATIEAARAGEAGKGFAVVASEVKELASQTSKATEEITAQISSIQSETQTAVVAVQSIGKTVEEMNSIAGAIAAAVEEQGAATNEIARNVEQASRGTQDVTDNILGVSNSASETKTAASDVATSAGAVSRDAAALQTEVEAFLSGVRAA
ncbi:methyl-accepting chemotaxis protein [Roseibium algae]